MKGAERNSDENVDWAERLPHLYGLFAGYLIESWTSVYGTPAAALQDGIEHRGLSELRATLAELEELRAQNLGDDELDRILFHQLGSYVHRPDGRYSAWLDEVGAQLADAIRVRSIGGTGS